MILGWLCGTVSTDAVRSVRVGPLRRFGRVMLSVVVAGREDDRPPLEALEVARTADRLGYGELWVGESGPTWDSFALAAAVARETERIALSIGPIPVSVRDPASIGRGAASVAALAGGRPVGVALGTSSVRVVETFHGRCRAGAASVLARSAEEVRRLITPGMTEPGEEVIRGAHFRRRLPPGGGPLSVAAFGDRAIAVAARYADRMLLDLVSPGQVRGFRERLDRASAEAGRAPRLVAWLPVAVDPTDAAYERILTNVAGYLTVRGYDEAFTAAGYGEAVELAAAGADTARLVAALPREAAGTVGAVGDLRSGSGADRGVHRRRAGRDRDQSGARRRPGGRADAQRAEG